MNVNHEAEESNWEIEYNSESKNEDDDNPEPTPGKWFRQVSHQMNNDAGHLNPYWIILNNQSTVHIFSNHTLLVNIQDTDDPIDVYSSGGATHCSKAGTLKNIGEVYLHGNRLANTLSYVKVKDKHNTTYDDVGDIFTVHTPYKRIHFRRSKRGLYYHNCKPNGKKRDVTFLKTVEENKEGFTNR